MKFAVTATTISDVALCLISNYNGEGNHSKDLSALGHLRVYARLIMRQDINIFEQRGPPMRYCSGRRKSS
jgi:hypothetical protein